MPPTGGDNAPLARRPPAADLKVALTCAATPQFPFLLQWNDILDADYYKVYRDNVLIAQTCVALYPDAPVNPSSRRQYRVEAFRDGRRLAQETVLATSPDSVARVVIEPVVRWKRAYASIQWPAPATLHVACYQVERAVPQPPGKFVSVAELPAVHVGLNQVTVALTPGKTVYRITPLNQAGRKLPPFDVPLQWPNDELQEVVLDEIIADATVRGKVEVAVGCAICRPRSPRNGTRRVVEFRQWGESEF